MIAKIITLILLTFFTFNGCGKKEESKINESVETTPKVEEQANVINLKTTDGQIIKLTALDNGIDFESYKNKIVLLSFFATWCGPCKTEIPHLNNIQTSYKDKIQIIGVLLEESKTNSQMENFIQNFNIIYPITNSRENFRLSDALGGIRSLPTMVMYDKNGEYFTHFVGAVPQEMIEKEIQKALAK